MEVVVLGVCGESTETPAHRLRRRGGQRRLQRALKDAEANLLLHAAVCVRTASSSSSALLLEVALQASVATTTTTTLCPCGPAAQLVDAVGFDRLGVDYDHTSAQRLCSPKLGQDSAELCPALGRVAGQNLLHLPSPAELGPHRLPAGEVIGEDLV